MHVVASLRPEALHCRAYLEAPTADGTSWHPTHGFPRDHRGTRIHTRLECRSGHQSARQHKHYSPRAGKIVYGRGVPFGILWLSSGAPICSIHLVSGGFSRSFCVLKRVRPKTAGICYLSVESEAADDAVQQEIKPILLGMVLIGTPSVPSGDTATENCFPK